MSLFGSLMGDIEEDPFFGSHMNMMRQMNTMMNSFFSDPFSMGFGDFDRGHRMSNSLMPFSMPIMPNFNRLLSGSLDSLGAHSYSSSTVVSMSSGPDGRPQVYKATSSTRTAPGGIKETQKTVTDTRSGTKKMAIGHHIGERAHIIEKEQNMHTGDREERQDFINLDEEEAEDFNKEWETKTRSRSEIPRICSGSVRNRHGYGAPGGMLAITGGPSRRRQRQSTPMVSPRRSIRSSPLTVPQASASSRTPYSPPGQVQNVRKSKNVKTVSGSPPPPPPADL
ncbi:Myeloid leukemia factor-like Protein [Tribolium castaneum]|uniref:Myeloid leukemia factor-like Protein n=1 Tax=Tribolium castaneum TaxID=7070 RepID=D6WUY7_TRICA|nr:PREDICTED: myeloid leukemia factor isoform X1 [Tribolium castaneum]EFA08509.2 Myeloid leukemia factor-like Protein [Tribolium castaneum]|eukprot:XP_008196190.1 PREDICTED: myeloid leukemia factor isoform X1 [Tribolium castaneum]